MAIFVPGMIFQSMEWVIIYLQGFFLLLIKFTKLKKGVSVDQTNTKWPDEAKCLKAKYKLKFTKHYTSNLSSPSANILIEVPRISGLSVKYIILTQYLLLTSQILVLS